jgi:hypothetical protein
MEKVWLPAMGEPTDCCSVFFPEPSSRRKCDCGDDHAQGEPDEEAERHLECRAVEQRNGWQGRERHHVDVAGLDRLGHAGPLEVEAELVSDSGQGVHPTREPHLLLGHRRENRHRGAAPSAQPLERLDTRVQRADVAANCGDQLVLGALGQ